MQPEWAKQQAIWTAWPSHEDLWQADLKHARREVAAMVKALAEGETVKLLVMGDDAELSAWSTFGNDDVEIIPAKFGDIWLRDTAPIFTHDTEGLKASCFKFNGWGGKYKLPFDNQVSELVAKHAKAKITNYDVVMEGGSLDFDGAGAVMTTKECLLNENRNPTMSVTDIENFLRKAFRVTRIIWLNQGLINDHTDGHVDNIARFVGPNLAVCPTASGADDPNATTFDVIAHDLEKAGVRVIRIPSPGLITDEDAEPVAASHMNFIIGNEVVIVPAYEDNYINDAVAALTPLFPGRKVIALPARHILTGGGSFHCITQQEPAIAVEQI